MNGFSPYVSATADAAANQHFFIENNGGKPVCGRVFLRLLPGRGDVPSYRMWFSNALDATYGAGTTVYANALCEPWEILRACVWAVPDFPETPEEALRIRKRNAVTLTFEGKEFLHLEPGAVLPCDPFRLPKDAASLALELEFKGHILPYHHESLLPVLRKGPGGWTYDVRVPLPVMTGMEEDLPMIGFLGDSITQGIGSGASRYSYPSLIAEAFAGQASVYNLGIGYARAWDAATDGFWLTRAKQCDPVVVALGVNDICQGVSAEELCGNLKAVLLSLREGGCATLLLTPFPFDWTGEKREVWNAVLFYCEEELRRLSSGFLRTDTLLSLDTDEPWKAGFGAHPNAEGHRRLATAVETELRKLFHS